MIDISLTGLLGAIAGTAVAALCYGALIGIVERALRADETAQTADERASSEESQALVRRIVLALDILICGGVGYWLGSLIGA